MDTFFEQIVAMKKSGKQIAALVGIWIAAVIVLAALVMFLAPLGTFAFLLAVGAIWGAVWLSKRLNVEYEYIVTNGSLDVDKIVARSSRSRVLSCELSAVERFEKFNPSAPPVGNYKKSVYACNADDPNACVLVVSEDGKGTRLLVFSPNERLLKAVLKGLPKFIANSAYRDFNINPNPAFHGGDGE